MPERNQQAEWDIDPEIKGTLAFEFTLDPPIGKKPAAPVEEGKASPTKGRKDPVNPNMYLKPLIEQSKLEKFIELLLKFREEEDEPN